MIASIAIKFLFEKIFSKILNSSFCIRREQINVINCIQAIDIKIIVFGMPFCSSHPSLFFFFFFKFNFNYFSFIYFFLLLHMLLNIFFRRTPSKRVYQKNQSKYLITDLQKDHLKYILGNNIFVSFKSLSKPSDISWELSCNSNA